MSDKIETSKALSQLPILALRNAVLFPGAVMPVVIGRGKSIRLLESLGDRRTAVVGVVAQKDKGIDNPSPDDLYWAGCTGQLIKVLRNGTDTYHVVIRGVDRFKITKFDQEEPFLSAEVELLDETGEDNPQVEALVHSLRESAIELVGMVPELPINASDLQEEFEHPSRLVYLLLTHLGVSVEEKVEVLKANGLADMVNKTLQLVMQQVEILRISQRINSEVKGELNKSQREYVLRKQLKAIQKELGDLDGEGGDELAELEERLTKVELPEEAQKIATKELKRLRSIQQGSPEYTVARTYLEWFADLPWSKVTEDNLDLEHAQEVLDSEHYGLQKVKRRLIEFLAVSKLKNDLRGPILCLVGPPGVGKTSLGRSVAEALGRKFQRVSLGGVRDEAEIRGHRRTYIGAMPGKIIMNLKKAGTANPVVMLDEVDKLTHDWRGDPTAAMLEVLDPEQNDTFTDHYLDTPYDLSKVLFIATANTTETIPAPLLDRMELIELSGYTLEEKQNIARQHLLPKQVKSHGLAPEQIEITEDILTKIIGSYTREAGVRTLERRIADVCRRVAVGVVKEEYTERTVTDEDLVEILGAARYEPEVAERTERPGVATGMAWTRSGGDLLFIEAAKIPGKGKMRLTGQLGDVMKESAQIALSMVEANAAEYGIARSAFQEYDLHVHFPAGGIPKDGPSAGVTMFTALISLLTDVPVRGDVSMTGEATLRGLVLPVGGIKDKVLAALRGGVKKVILPEKNRRDLRDIPQSAQDELEIVFVSRMEEVLEHALEVPPSAWPKKKNAPLPPAVA
ncbi:MAG: endopeptidase La [Myxococcales bacterium]|nr:endopeptidase La [Myxococcales bacterium]